MSCLVSPAHYEIFKNTEKVKNKKVRHCSTGFNPSTQEAKSEFQDSQGCEEKLCLEKPKHQNTKRKRVNKFLTATVASSINDPPASARDYKHWKPQPAEAQLVPLGRLMRNRTACAALAEARFPDSNNGPEKLARLV